MADHETWIWHAFFRMLGSCNDINVLQRSLLMTRIANGETPPVQYVANGKTYNYGYYLADGIYPKWQTFVKPVIKPLGKKEVDFIMHKHRLGKMWREHLEFCNLNLLL